jgi:alanyl-tRNA synthetase
MREIERELVALKSAQALASAAKLMEQQEVIAGCKEIMTEVEKNISGDDLRTMALDLRNRDSQSVIGLLSQAGDRVTLVVAASDEARTLGVNAGALVKVGSTVLGGGGGGKDDFAQGGGTLPEKIHDAIAEMKVALTALLVK